MAPPRYNINSTFPLLFLCSPYSQFFRRANTLPRWKEVIEIDIAEPNERERTHRAAQLRVSKKKKKGRGVVQKKKGDGKRWTLLFESG